MKVIDEKGKLFGKLNIIDCIVLILVVAVAAVLVLKVTGGGGDGLKGGTQLTYTVEVQGVKPQVYQEIKQMLDKKPSQLMASGDLLNGHVVSVTASPSAKTHLDVALEGENKGAIQTTESDLLDLVFTVDVTVTNTVTNEVGSQEVRVGKSHIIKTTQFELDGGVILSCETKSAA